MTDNTEVWEVEKCSRDPPARRIKRWAFSGRNQWTLFFGMQQPLECKGYFVRTSFIVVGLLSVCRSEEHLLVMDNPYTIHCAR